MDIGGVLSEAWGLYKRFFWQFFLTAAVVFAVLDLFSALADAAAGDSILAGLFWGLIAATVSSATSGCRVLWSRSCETCATAAPTAPSARSIKP